MKSSGLRILQIKKADVIRQLFLFVKFLSHYFLINKGCYLLQFEVGFAKIASKKGYSMLQSIEELSSVTRKLSIEIPSSVIESELSKAYKELKSSVNVPGFRKGKVPQAILQKRFSKSVEAEIMSKLVPEYYAEAVKESGIIPVAQPKIDIDGELKITKDNPVLFSATVEVRPEVKDLDYEGIELEKEEATVPEEDIEKELERMQKERASYEPSDKELEEQDMAVIDYFGSIDGESIKELEQTDHQFVLDSKELPDEFKNALLNKKKEDTCEFSIFFPDTFDNKALAGKTVDFKVSVKEVKKLVTQPIDDEFAKDIGYETLDELKETLKNQILERRSKAINENYKKVLIAELLKRHEIEVPPTMVEEQLSWLMETEKIYAQILGAKPPEIEDSKAQIKDKAIEQVKLIIMLSAIGKTENLEVEEEDIKDYFRKMSLEMGIKTEDLQKYYLSRDNALEGIRNEIYINKILDLVLSKAKFKEKL